MKKLLSIVAILSLVFSPITPVFAAGYTLVGNATWASAGDRTQADVTHAAADDTVDVDTFTLNVTNNGTASDTAGVTNVFTLGGITDTNSGGAGTGSVTTTTGSANDLSVTIASATVAGNFLATNRDGDNASNTTEMTGGLSFAEI
jgi:hypothetical protein